MAENSGIEWTDHTFNPWWGCVHAGYAECDNCYAEELAERYGFVAGGAHFPIWGQTVPRRGLSDKNWDGPLKWNRDAEKAGKRARVFCASMADVFEFRLGDNRVNLNEARARLWELIEKTPNLDWMLLTKRPGNITRMVPPSWLEKPRTNVWYGTSVGVKATTWRIEALQQVPAAVRFVSCEPLLEDLGLLDLSGIHLVIVGGESGDKARPMHPEWARSLRDQCVGAGVRFFFKQWGEWAPGECVKKQTGTVQTAKWFDDRWIFSKEDLARDGHIDDQPDLYRVGKQAAGRLLDGREWNEMPTPTDVKLNMTQLNAP